MFSNYLRAGGLMFYVIFTTIRSLFIFVTLSNLLTVSMAQQPETVTPQVRESRNSTFNMFGPGFPRLDEKPENAPPAITMVYWGFKPEMPYAESDLVIRASLNEIRPYLSEDGRAIYSEYLFDVNEVLKPSARAVIRGDQVTLIRLGGQIKTQSGRVLEHRVDGSGDSLRPGKSYVLFLNYSSKTDAYVFVKAWLIEQEKMIPVTPDDKKRKESGSSKYADMTYSDVANQLRSGK